MMKTHYGPFAEAQFDWYGDGTERFTEFLDAANNRPFFLWVAFHDPHRGYRLGAFDPPHTRDQVTVPQQLVDNDATRADLALYYDEVARMDGEMAEMVDILHGRGLADNTLLLYMSDNGAPFPREKGTVYDAGIRTPLVIVWPGVVAQNSVYSGLVSAVDLAPTFLEMAGISPPETMVGSSLIPALEDPSIPGREYVFSERNWHDCDEHIRSVRTERYKLIINAYTELPLCTAADIGGSPSFRSLLAAKQSDMLTPQQKRLFEVPRARIELYDVIEDPGEFVNLAGKPGFDATIRELVTVLQKWMEDTADFPPTTRRRDDHTDRITGIRFMNRIPALRED
jgi:arylsulfatase A-like enzyme